MRRDRTVLSVLLLLSLGWACAAAQPPNRPPSVADSIKSVEVTPDNRVTFKLYAPKALAVSVSGDFLMGAPPASLAKNDDGVWSVTTGPIPPDSYTYTFDVDGVTVLDTKSAVFKENPNALFSFFDMPGLETDFMALKNVPHGRVEEAIYHSNSLNAERRIHVYLPPNFEKIKGKLPVLYLLHGVGDNDISWTSAGKVNFILDNLYAAGKLKNMIVVMPAGHTSAPGFAGFSIGPDADPFRTDFLNDLMPFVAKTYPVSTKREDTAIAGFSMGGAQTLSLALFNPEKFAYVFPISTGYFPNGAQEMADKYGAVLKNVAAHPFTQFYIGKGKQDMLMAQNSAATLKMLDQFGIKYQYKEMNGAHSFVFSRRFLAFVLPLAFQPQ